MVLHCEAEMRFVFSGWSGALIMQRSGQGSQICKSFYSTTTTCTVQLQQIKAGSKTAVSAAKKGCSLIMYSVAARPTAESFFVPRNNLPFRPRHHSHLRKLLPVGRLNWETLSPSRRCVSCHAHGNRCQGKTHIHTHGSRSLPP